MSIFGTIMSKLFHHAEAGPTPTTAPQAAPGSVPADTAGPPPAPDPFTSSTAGAETEVATSTPPTAPPSTEPVDVGAILDGLAAKSSQRLDWKHSIVDMMKLLDMDSSLTARKALAAELHYDGDTDDSATMNIWLHKEVMQKIAENGGKLPADLKA